MPVHPAFMRRIVQNRNLPEKMKKKVIKISRARFLFGIAKMQRNEIGLLSAELGISEKRLFDYFERLQLKNMSFEERVNTLVETLTEMKELAQKTEVSKKKLRHFVEKNGIEWVMKEMGKRAQEIEAIQARQNTA